MLRNKVCHPIVFLLSFILFIIANTISSSINFTIILSIVVLLLLLKTDISFYVYLYFGLPFLCLLILFNPNIIIKIINICFYFLFFVYHQNDLSLFYICSKIPFLNEKITNKLYTISKIPNYTETIVNTYKLRVQKKFLNPISFYKFLRNKIQNEQNNMIITNYEKAIYMKKIKQGNLYELRLFDIIFLIFHGIIVLIVMGGVLWDI